MHIHYDSSRMFQGVCNVLLLLLFIEGVNFSIWTDHDVPDWIVNLVDAHRKLHHRRFSLSENVVSCRSIPWNWTPGCLHAITTINQREGSYINRWCPASFIWRLLTKRGWKIMPPNLWLQWGLRWEWLQFLQSSTTHYVLQYGVYRTGNHNFPTANQIFS